MFFFLVSWGYGMFCFLRGETKRNDVSLFYSCACICVCMYVYMYVRMCVYVCVCTYVWMFACMRQGGKGEEAGDCIRVVKCRRGSNGRER